MAIKTKCENLVRFTEAKTAFPGRSVSLATLHRWRESGVRGTKLETCLVGGTRFTSTEAIDRFLESQNRGEVDASLVLVSTGA